MRNNTYVINPLLALVLAVFASSWPTGFSADSKSVQVPAALEKAQKINLGSLELPGISLDDVVNMLRQDSARRDPERKGVKITLAANAKAKGRMLIKLSLKNVSLAQALERIAQAAGLRVQATEAELTLVPKPKA